MKFQGDISLLNITDAKFQSPNFRKRAMTLKRSIIFFFKFSPDILLIILYQLTQVSTSYLKYFLRYGTYKIAS